MLATYRLPILDARSFVADADIANSVILPRAWSEGDFVRGLGRVTRRLNNAVEPWSYESAFANLGRTLTFSPDALQALNHRAECAQIRTVRKRAWLALPNSTALFDVDLGLQIDPVGSRGVDYPRGGQFDLAQLADFVASAAALPVHLRAKSDRRAAHPMVKLGKPLAADYASMTSPLRNGDRMVGAGQITVVVEAPGMVPEIPRSVRTEQLRSSRVQLASLNASVPGGGSMKIHVLWDNRGTKGDRKRIRELRIHILRLHSIFELMRFLASPVVLHSKLPLADSPGTPGFDQLQRTILECVRVVRTQAAIGNVSPLSILDAAFYSKNFVDRDLQMMLRRLLGAMRPKVSKEVELFIEEEERRSAANLRADQERNQLGPKTIIINGEIMSNFYEINGPVVGPVGDNAKVEGNLVGGTAHIEGDLVAGSGRTISFRGKSFPSDVLLEELRILRDHISKTDAKEGPDAVEQLAEAQEKAESGDSNGVLAALKKAGTWVLGITSQIGVPVAQAALEAALGV